MCRGVFRTPKVAQATFPGQNGNIAYAGWDGNDYEIYTINSGGGGTPVQLTNNTAADTEPTYSPDGTKIAYSGQDGPNGDFEIYTINAGGGTPFNVTNNTTNDYSPSYSPDGTKIAYSGYDYDGFDWEVYTIDASGGGTPFNVTNNTTDDWEPSWGVAAEDTAPPKVTSTSPANNATGVARTANATATFSEDMDASTTDGDPSTITATTFKLLRLNANGTTTRVTASVSYDAPTKKATLNPSSNLSSGATYKATMTSGAQDEAGDALDQNSTKVNDQPKNWEFTVR